MQSPNEEPKKKPITSKGVAMSFGFKKRPTTATVIGNVNAARRLANADVIDRNGNSDDFEPLMKSVVPTGRTTPKLPAPKKEPNATTRISRFGFRQPNANRHYKVSDSTASPHPLRLQYVNNNISDETIDTTAKLICDSNKNKTVQATVGRFKLQTTQLPKPQVALHVSETKFAKTIANNSRKINTMQPSGDEGSSKDGSMTEDSGVGSQTSGNNPETDTLKGLEQLDSSPTFGVRRHIKPKPRNLDVILTGHKFDVRDLNDESENVNLPRLPNAFQTYHTTGFVKDRAQQYQRNIERERRKVSVTSSEEYSDDYGEEIKTFRENYRSEKYFSKPQNKSFMKTRQRDEDSTNGSSDDQEWTNAGEAMADAISCSFSSSDESRGRRSPQKITGELYQNSAQILKNSIQRQQASNSSAKSLQGYIHNQNDYMEIQPKPKQILKSIKQTVTDSPQISNISNIHSPILNISPQTHNSSGIWRSPSALSHENGKVEVFDNPLETVAKINNSRQILSKPVSTFNNFDSNPSYMNSKSRHLNSKASKTTLDYSDSKSSSSDSKSSNLTTKSTNLCLKTHSFSEKLSNLSPSSPSILPFSVQNLINTSLNTSISKNEIKNVLLTIEDPKFAAIAAASNTGNLIEDETSPTDSLISDTEDLIKKKLTKGQISKEVKEKESVTPPSPGTPTNASNSLSLSEGRDFLIDDEIADQPALIFDDGAQNSETTLMEGTPRSRRKVFSKIDGSPLAVRNRKLLKNRTGSLDTLSPCESIASDDLMMDFDRSQSSGLDDIDR